MEYSPLPDYLVKIINNNENKSHFYLPNLVSQVTYNNENILLDSISGKFMANNSQKFEKRPLVSVIQTILRNTISGSFVLGTVFSGLVYATENPVEQKTEKKSEVMKLPTLSVVEGLHNSNSAGSSVLKKADIDRTQADNIAQLLDQLPGVSMSGSPRPGGQTLNIWGMGDTEDVKVTLDDSPKGFEKYRQGSVFIEPELIKRVDVDKGPHNLLDGNGGFGGSIKIVTKDANDLLRPDEHWGGLIKQSYHTNDRQWINSGALYGRDPDGFIDGLLYVSKRDGHNIKRPDGTHFEYSQNNQTSYLLKSNIYPNDSHTISLSAMRSESDGWQPWAAKRDKMNYPSTYDVEKYGWNGAWKRKLVFRDQVDQNYSVKWNIAPEDNLWMNLTITQAYSKTEQVDRRPENVKGNYSSSMGHKSWVNYTDYLTDINNKSVFSTGIIEHELLMGAKWHKHLRNVWMFDKDKLEQAEYNYGYYQPYYMPAGKQTTYSLYLQDSMTFSNFVITSGVRYDHIKNVGKGNAAPRFNNPLPEAGHDYSGVTYTGWAPHLGIMWKVTPSLSLFSDISRTWRAPVVDEQYEVQSNETRIPSTSRNLNIERMTGIRLGAILDFDNLMLEDDSLQIRTTLFRNRGKDEIFKRRGIYCEAQIESGATNSCGKPLENHRNLPGYSIEGLEIETFYDSNTLFGKLSFSTMRGQRDTSIRDPWLGDKSWIAEIPPTSAHAMLGFKIPQWQMAMGWKGDFYRRQDRSPEGSDLKAEGWSLPESSGYALHGLFASWRPTFIKGFEARITVDNLFNRDYYPYLGEKVSGIGRNYKFSISQQF
ncbi:TonB-dependent hemoglobin/transferrin/lactoferrin family receptor [Xenorhabdus nematophila]|uniref:TonB-dependent hemoglobin/transferrin/lactoferrin family receptor n=1 Tax=Xenorhabdus nematophila TaxID=628 RepID=UPI00054206AC|nr:TonB-dependent hemoglobin/transferrin/lactoferrin family receptor [Xenorhabdus nematophila]CEF29282.1 Heme/hemopexin utilization protein C precursor [Xenorhabdus nematophila str. Websteri]AYA39542.1 TonB-dependent hemoglobin/transferrin/lactoferrin family receptor [Xenorhabdus nematophila]KHD28940.1 TonB-dependent receptor [Xenorhabdus nematophila]MBA0018105.1 TonB-dependent hemoglobin/transferrin/lactoferrin family receptor [Xenorhabdus nematophila]MCB4426193.1 TonB-dependent hemoglobin/tr